MTSFTQQHFFAVLPYSASAMGQALHPWGLLSSQTLSHYLEHSVRIPREDTSEVFSGAVLPAVESILQEVRRRDQRFSASFVRSGSYIEGLKVSEPDEFDFLVPLEGVPVKGLPWWETVSLPEPPPDRAFQPILMNLNGLEGSLWGAGDVSDALWWQFTHTVVSGSQYIQCYKYMLCADGYAGCGVRLLNPDKVMGTFQRLVADVTASLSSAITVYRRKKESPAVTLKIHFNNREINVDLVPLIKKPFCTWSFQWPRPGRVGVSEEWPSHAKIQEVIETGVDWVAKHNYYWRHSFSRIERVLLEKIDEDGGQRRNSLKILKKIREDLWKNKFGKVLVSYHLKTILFWACEDYPFTNAWQDLAESFKRLVNYLTHYLSSGFLPHYILGQEVNLFKAQREDLNAVCREVLGFQEAPMNYFQKTM